MGIFSRKSDDIEVEVEEEPTDKKRVVGKIVFLNEEDGWGFIISKEIKFSRIFFHWTALEQSTLHFTELKKGMQVEFNPKWYEENGWRAIRLVVLEDSNDKTKE